MNKLVGSESDGIFFTEAADVPGALVLGEVRVKVYGQNKDLRHVKSELARQVRRKKGNALIAFTYGQRSTFLSGDHWYGAGRAADIPGR